VHHHLVGVDGAAARLLADPQGVEGPEGVGAELDARTDLAELRRLLEHLDGKALARQRERRGEATDATTGNEDGKGSRCATHDVSSCDISRDWAVLFWYVKNIVSLHIYNQ
jgi:hypothetical protein